MKKVLVTFLSFLSVSTFAISNDIKQFEGLYQLDDSLMSTKDCPAKINVSSFAKSGEVQIFIEKSVDEQGTQYGDFVKFDLNLQQYNPDRTYSSFSHNVFGDRIEKVTEVNQWIVKREYLRMSGNLLIWQIQDYKNKRNNRTCFYI